MAKKPDSSPAQSRVYNNQVSVDTDLFVLKTKQFRKNVSWNDSPEYHQVDHMHFFHTFDSGGKKLTRSTMVGGHFHVMTEEPQEKGPPVVKCGPPMKELINKKRQKIVVPFDPPSHDPNDPDPGDSHTHDVGYVRSNKIQIRTMNAEAAAAQVALTAAGAPIPGIG